MRRLALAMTLFLLIFLFQSFAPAQNSKPVIVLVPGYLNSWAPGFMQLDPAGHLQVAPYFSVDIVRTIQKAGYDVEVISDLMPIGTLEENGVLLADFLVKVTQRYPGRSLVLINHSAGGLYTLHALQLHPELPITTVLTISTPYEGSGIVEALASGMPVLVDLAKSISLPSILQFRPKATHDFMATHSIPSGLRWIAVGSYEPACPLFSCGRADQLPWLFSLMQNMLGEKSDGIVSVQSATAANLNLPIERWDLVLPLEHSQLVMDPRFFQTADKAGQTWIRETQVQVYEMLLKRLGL